MAKHRWWTHRQSGPRQPRVRPLPVNLVSDNIRITDAYAPQSLRIDANVIHLNGTNVEEAINNLNFRVDTIDGSSGVVDYTRLDSAINNLQMQGYMSHELEEGLRVLMEMTRSGDINALQPVISNMGALGNGTL